VTPDAVRLGITGEIFNLLEKGMFKNCGTKFINIDDPIF
jgi:nucleoside diphosphate kinase